MKVLFSKHAWEDYEYWLSTDTRILKRVNLLIRDTCRDPFRGIGKPEPLRHALKGYWSRRITDEHRMVYRVEGDILMLAQLRYHYGK
ncbi:MAG: Txe/YoeB family addiction module toxin [Opitutae bacterium]|nr:Txe/YoeB family addiction module toxin [Opitutae bacterium]MBC9888694.1 Txe/YoeB family addiction module toxin [Opitutae bacterium]